MPEPSFSGRILRLILTAVAAFAAAGPQAQAAPDVVLAENGQARAAIYVPPEVMAPGAPDRLRASVLDLARCLQLISGAEIPVLTHAPAAGDTRVPILVGPLAEAVFGGSKKDSPSRQGWRLVVSPKGVGMIGQSELAVSYAIYELLDRFGCRWFMPGPLGEDLPAIRTLSLPELDISDAPATGYRGLRYADETFDRRNRLGGARLPADQEREACDVASLAPAPACPAHSLLDTNCPAAAAWREAIEQCHSRSQAVVWCGTGFNAGELTAPYPLMRRWSEETPFLLTHGVAAWLPDTRRTFANSLPGLYLGCRLAWYPHARPKDVLDEFFTRFYGAAAESMRGFWTGLDQAWSDTPDHSANAWGYLRRFTPGVMARARHSLDQAAAAARTDTERDRVSLADAMFGSFERLMRLRRDLADGRLAGLEADALAWLDDWAKLAGAHADDNAFEPHRTPLHVRRYLLPTCRDASRIAADFTVLGPPLRTWRYAVEANEPGEALGWPAPDFEDAAWDTTDSCVDTWSALGLWNHDTTVWYRARAPVPPLPKGTRVFLWLSAVDGVARAFVNGRPVPATTVVGSDPAVLPYDYARPGSFDITAAVRPGQTNHLALVVTRRVPADPGSGGLLGPACLYHERLTSP